VPTGPDALERLRRGAAGVGVILSEADVSRLVRYVDLLALWNRRIRLTGTREIGGIVERHVVDSLAVVPFVPPRGPVVDLGSGAGFPGIVIACLRPELRVVLIEARRRRVSFLREVIRSIPLPSAEALELRAEAAAADDSLAGRTRLVVARAIRLDAFLALAVPLLAADGEAIAMQTPRTAAGASAAGLRLRRTHEYRLPGGERRLLLVYARG
jgi:16S rRNA (guanine527-N7)-methyltransferase